MKAQIEKDSHVGKQPRILLIEDEAALSKVLSLVLTGGGFDVCVATTGAHGLRLAEEKNYDLILSDIDLPDMDGFEICRRSKQNPKIQAVPIILMSGRLREENEAQALKLGAADYLSKPFRAEIVLTKISLHIREAKKGL
jgi:DNA-binding response OmpR family regulator